LHAADALGVPCSPGSFSPAELLRARHPAIPSRRFSSACRRSPRLFPLGIRHFTQRQRRSSLTKWPPSDPDGPGSAAGKPAPSPPSVESRVSDPKNSGPLSEEHHPSGEPGRRDSPEVRLPPRELRTAPASRPRRRSLRSRQKSPKGPPSRQLARPHPRRGKSARVQWSSSERMHDGFPKPTLSHGPTFDVRRTARFW
jgi:hypothetical protein